MVVIRKINEAYLQVEADQGIIRELSEVLTFEVPNAHHKRRMMEKRGFKSYSQWDGRIRLLDYRNGAAYLGLHRFIRQYCEENGYEISYEDGFDNETPFSRWEAQKFFESLNLSAAVVGLEREIVQVRDYQENAVVHGIQRRRAILVSPTASGKSLIIYLLLRYLQQFKIDESERILVIVPTTSLVEQMYSDFADYSALDESWNVEDHCDRVHANAARVRNTDKQVIITTWQSIYRQPPEWFCQFSAVFGDEAHQYDSKSLSGIMSSLVNAQYRFATTGTLKGSLVNEMVLEGLFGEVYNVTTTRALMDAGTVADLTIKALVLRYSPEDCETIKGADFHAERDFIVSHPLRRNFVRNLVLSLKGNTLVLFGLVDKQGKPLYESILERVEPGRKVFYVSGQTEADDRERVRAITEKEENAIIIASYGVFSTGVNIRNLDNLVFAAGTRSKIRTLQSIGRGLRKSDRKSTVTVFDIVDDLSVKAKKNFALAHFTERLSYYAAEQFRYKIYRIELGSS